VNVAAQVAPIGIGEIYERDLLSAIPVLPLFLSRDGVRRSLVRFDMDQSIDAILGGVDDLAVAVLCEASRQVGRTPMYKARPVWLATM